jgi:hypothetical protein
MADEEKQVKTPVLITGIDELSPKLGALRVKVESFKKNLEQTGLGKLDISGLFKGGSVITPKVAQGETSANLEKFNKALDNISLKIGQALHRRLTAWSRH